MNSLELAVKNALESQGGDQEINKAYLEFIKANFFIPIESTSAPDNPEVLFFTEAGHTFLPVFTAREQVDLWAKDIQDKIQLLHLSGVDLLKGIGEEVTVCLNIGSSTYKEFNPAEISRMRGMVLKLFK